jgi:phytoene desaturase
MGKGKKIVIAGGGVGGLVVGIYAQKAGFESVIYEKNSFAGGACTGWDREEFHIDGCINWLLGTKEGRAMNRIWQETGALNNVEVYYPDSFLTVSDETGSLHLWRDIDKLKAHLVEISPPDKEEIENMLRTTAVFQDFEPSVEKPMDMMNSFEKLRFILKNRKVFPEIGKYSRITTDEYLVRFNSSLIRTALAQLVPGNYSAHNLFFILAAFTGGNAGIPRGGSRALSERLQKKYELLLGEIEYNSEVEEIIVENDRAAGFILRGGKKVYGDYVITACDPAMVYNRFLKGCYVDGELEKRYWNREIYPLKTGVYIAFEIDAGMSSIPGNSVLGVGDVLFEDKVINRIALKHFAHEPSFSPPGKSLATVYLDGSYEWWKKLYENQGLYKMEKTRIAGDIAVQIEKQFMDFSGKTRVLDVATPVTWERYCGSYMGSWYSFGNTPSGEPLKHPGVVEGINNLYMTGHWLMPPGGLPGAAITGKWTLERIARNR